MKKILSVLNRLEEGTLVVGLLGLAFMSFIEVISRYLFNHSFTWFEEFARYFGVFLTFLGASLGVKYGMHFSMDYVVTRVGPTVGRIMRIVGCLLAAALFFYVSYLAFRHCSKMFRYGVTSAAMKLPMYLAYAPITLFGFTMSVRLVGEAWRHFKAIKSQEALFPSEKIEDQGEEAGS